MKKAARPILLFELCVFVTGIMTSGGNGQAPVMRMQYPDQDGGFSHHHQHHPHQHIHHQGVPQPHIHPAMMPTGGTTTGLPSHLKPAGERLEHEGPPDLPSSPPPMHPPTLSPDMEDVRVCIIIIYYVVAINLE